MHVIKPQQVFRHCGKYSPHRNSTLGDERDF